MVKKGQDIELDVSNIAFGGKGIAKVDGFAVFVDKAVAGDRVLARITKKKKSHAEARVLNLIEASPDRVDPPCRYSGHCGGCKWQFLNYAKQLEYKRQHVIDAVERIALIPGVRVEPTLPSDLIFGYRNKMEFTCSDRRWLLPEEMENGIDKGLAVGLHVPGTFNKTIDIEACLIQPDLGNAILGDARDFIKKSGLPVYGLKTHEGFWRFLMLRHSVAFDQWMVNIITSGEGTATLKPLAENLMKKYPQIVSVVNNVTSRKSAVAIGEYEIRLGGEPFIKDRIGGFEFEISANSFFQTNTLGAGRLYDTAKQYADLTGKETVLDLYSGTGAIAICMSDAAKSVVGIEIVDSAVNDAERNCQNNGVSNCRFIKGDVKDALSQIGERADLMIIDPPRDGMHKDIVPQVIKAAPERIVYVSCNPSTMARDMGMLKDHYGISRIQPVDMFPHTWHIESVARLDRK